MKAVVTGANGFAGKWLCKFLLAGGIDVEGWVREAPVQPTHGVNYRHVDVRDREKCHALMAKARPSSVYHLAAMTHLGDCEQHPEDAEAINVGGTKNVFDSMPSDTVGIFASTCHVYGRPQTLPISETHPLAPVGVYAETKARAETVAIATGKNVIIARAFHHTGPEQAERYALADWAGQVRRGAETVQVGDLSLFRDYCDVRDIVEGYHRLSTKGIAGQTYNLCSGKRFTLGQMFTWIARDTNAAAILDEKRIRPNDVKEFRGDPSKAEGVGWVRRRELKQTLAEMSTRSD